MNQAHSFKRFMPCRSTSRRDACGTTAAHRTAGFTMLELITVMVLLGVVSALSGVFMAPMVQSYSSGRRMVRTANASQFALDRLNQLMSRASAASISTGSGQISFTVQTGPATTEAIQISYDDVADALLLDGEPLMNDVADYTVAYSNGVIFNRIVFGAATGMPFDLNICPRNE